MAPTCSDYGQPPLTPGRIVLWVRPPWGSRQRFFGRFEILPDSFLETSETPRAEKVSILFHGSSWAL
jgi:hypothetical protein